MYFVINNAFAMKSSNFYCFFVYQWEINSAEILNLPKMWFISKYYFKVIFLNYEVVIYINV